MDSQSLAHLSNLVLYGAMGVLAFTMIAFAVHLAYTASARSQHTGRQRERTPVAVAAGVGERATVEELPQDVVSDSSSGSTSASASGSSSADPSERAASDAASRADLGTRAGGIAMSLAWLGTLLLGFSLVLRGLSVHRAPVSNMFEFACAAAFLVMLVYLALAMKRPLRWLGLFVVTPVLLALGLAITVTGSPSICAS